MPKVRHSEEFKREAVAQVVEGHRRRSAVARACGISGTALYNWIKELAPEFHGTSPPTPAEPESELERLKRENAELREENRFLKKAAVRSTGHCNATSRVRLVDRRNDASSYTTTEREGES